MLQQTRHISQRLICCQNDNTLIEISLVNSRKVCYTKCFHLLMNFYTVVIICMDSPSQWFPLSSNWDIRFYFITFIIYYIIYHSTSQHSTNHQPTDHQETNHQATNHQPTNHQPTNNQPITSQPITYQPITSQPITSQPITNQPITNQLITYQPITSQPITSQSINNQPITSQQVGGHVLAICINFNIINSSCVKTVMWADFQQVLQHCLVVHNMYRNQSRFGFSFHYIVKFQIWKRCGFIEYTDLKGCNVVLWDYFHVKSAYRKC